MITTHANRTSGQLEKYSFDLKTTTFQVTIRMPTIASADCKDYSAFFLPTLHFPDPVTVSTAGRVENDKTMCLVIWWHDAAMAGQVHSLTITNSKD